MISRISTIVRHTGEIQPHIKTLLDITTNLLNPLGRLFMLSTDKYNNYNYNYNNCYDYYYIFFDY